MHVAETACLWQGAAMLVHDFFATFCHIIAITPLISAAALACNVQLQCYQYCWLMGVDIWALAVTLDILIQEPLHLLSASTIAQLVRYSVLTSAARYFL